MADLLWDNRDVDTGVEGDGGGAVTQVVQPDRGQPYLGLDPDPGHEGYAAGASVAGAGRVFFS